MKSLLPAIVFLLAPVVAAQPSGSGQAGEQSAVQMNARAVETALSIDGRLDEGAWAEAEPASGFTQYEPLEGVPATQRTEVRVLYGSNSLYVGAILHDEDPASVERALGPRDDYNRADWFLVSIDSYFDRRTAYVFGVNAAGVQLDGLRTGEGGGGGGGGDRRGGGLRGVDESWDAVWYSDVRRSPQGWVVEMRIPYSMLRFSEAAEQTWGIHFTRRIPRLGEVTEWPLVPRTERSNLVARFGLLQGIRGVEPRRNVQARPYSVTRLHTAESPEEPGTLYHESNLDVGVDLKVGLGTSTTLDLTFNPDFGQVESDPATLNLTAFETFFQERRPFFVEGSQIYDFSVGRGRLLYTRRIGADAPIVGAAKLSGRTERGLSFGILGAATGHDLNPNRYFGAARASQQFGDYSSVGAIVTGFDGQVFDRRIGGVHRQSVSSGADWDVRFAGNRYGFEGFAALTHRRAEAAGLAPETGLASSVSLQKRQGAWKGFTGASIVSDAFDPNDVGQLRQNNYVALLGNVDHDLHGGLPFGRFQRASVGGFAIQQFSYDEGLNLGQWLRVGSRWTLRGFQQVELSGSLRNFAGGYDLYETRGLGPWAQPVAFELQTEIQTDERRAWDVEPEFSITFNGDGGRGYGAGVRGNWNIGARLSLSGSLEGEWENDVTAWTANEAFLLSEAGWLIGREARNPRGLAPEDFVAFDDGGLLDAILGGVEPIEPDRYFVPIFGARDTRSLDLTVRGTATFTPKLSLQLYSQLFMARGRYDDFRILQNPDVLLPFGSYPKRDVFTFNNLQTNAVMRWEYRPGSALYLVWTHGRRAEDALNPLAPWGASPYERNVADQVGEVFSAFPENVFLVKLSYTFLR